VRMRVQYPNGEYGFSADSYDVKVASLGPDSVRITVRQSSRAYQEGDLGGHGGYLILPSLAAQRLAIAILAAQTDLSDDPTSFEHCEP